MILARVVRQFETAAGVSVALEQDFVFNDTPTMGTKLDLANVPEPLEVVSVTMRPRAETGVPAPPSIECYTAWEPADRLEIARQAGWRDPGARRTPEGHRKSATIIPQ